MAEMINFGGGVRMEMGPFGGSKSEKCAGLYYRDNQGPNYAKHVSRTSNTNLSYNFSNAQKYVSSTTEDDEEKRRRRNDLYRESLTSKVYAGSYSPSPIKY
jgi:hypothetical protein